MDTFYGSPLLLSKYCEAQARVRQGSARDGSHLRSPSGNYRQFFSELHPKVRQTCLNKRWMDEWGTAVKSQKLLLHVKCWHYYALLVFPTVHCSGQRLCWSGCGPVCSVAACRLGGNCMAECASSVPLLATRQPRAGHGDPVICRPPCRGHVHWIVSLISSTLYITQWPPVWTGGSPVTCEAVKWSEVPSHWPGLWCNDDVMGWSIYSSELSYISGCCQNIAVPHHHHHTTPPQHHNMFFWQ